MNSSRRIQRFKPPGRGGGLSGNKKGAGKAVRAGAPRIIRGSSERKGRENPRIFFRAFFPGLEKLRKTDAD